MGYRLFLLVFVLGCAAPPAAAQLTWSPFADLGYGWGGIDALGGRPARAGAVLGRTGMALRYRHNDWAAELGVGTKWLLPRGRFDGAPFRGRAARLILPLGVAHRLAGPGWLGLGYELQNERDLADLERRATHALRHSAWLRWQYPRGRWRLGITVHRALSDNPATFYLADPRWSAAFRAAYQLGHYDE